MITQIIQLGITFNLIVKTDWNMMGKYWDGLLNGRKPGLVFWCSLTAWAIGVGPLVFSG